MWFAEANHGQCSRQLFHLVRLIDVIALANHLGLDDGIGSRRTRGLRIAALKLREDLHPFDHAAEAGVSAVEMGRLFEGEKELRSAGVAAGVSHAQAPLKMPA